MQNNDENKNNRKNIFTLKRVIYSLIACSSSFILFFLLIFIFNKKWYDALSVCSIIHIGLAFLFIIYDFGEFKTFSKLKSLFAIRKENNEKLTKFEQKQMKILRIKENEVNDKNLMMERKITFRFVATSMIIFGFILLFISIPFCL